MERKMAGSWGLYYRVYRTSPVLWGLWEFPYTIITAIVLKSVCGILYYIIVIPGTEG